MPANSSWRKISLQGSAPWGFRLTDSKNQIQPGLQISKVRTRSNAYMAGLRDNDVILSINEIPTHSMSLQQASGLIDSCQSLQLTVFNSSYNQNNDVNQHNFVNENKKNNYNKFNSNVISELEEEGEKESIYEPIHYRDQTPSLSVASITKPGENQSYNNNRVLKNQTFSKFSTSSSYNNFNQKQEPIYRKPFYDYNTNNMRRNYFSATESCGEDTDVDDSSVFGFSNPSKQSYVSIKLRAPLKDVNYYSDTESSFPANSSRNFFKQQEQRYNSNSNINIKPAVVQHQIITTPPSIPKYQQSTAKPFIPNNAAVSIYNNKQSFSLLNRQAKPFVNQPTDNPYSPSPSASIGSNFKVPNIYDKLNPQQSNKQPSFNTNNYQDNDDYFSKNNNNNNNNTNTNQLQNYQTIGEQEDLEFQKYELEMGTELLKHSEKPNYSDSYFYNNPSVNYPTIDDQKRLARVIASTLEGSDPQTSKFHKYKKKQSISEPNENESFNSPETLNFNDSLQNSTSNNVFVHDHNLPDIIRKSIALAERIDPVRQVYATDEFKKNHYTKHTTHTEADPQAAISLAAALQIGVQSRGAQIFQKRKAKSEKWVVDEQTVTKPAFTNFIAPPPVKFNPPPEPVVSVPMPQVSRKQFVLAQKYEENQQNKFSDFNNKPRGWNSGDSEHHQSVPRSIHPNLSIDQSIREGIEELHFSNEPLIVQQPPTPVPRYIEPVKIQKNIQENKTFSMTKDGIQMIKDRLLAERQEQKSIQNMQNFDNHKQNFNRFYEPVKLNFNENFTPVPTISKVKLNKLNTSDFFTNPVPQSYVSPSFSFQNTTNYHDDNIATSDL